MLPCTSPRDLYDHSGALCHQSGWESRMIHRELPPFTEFAHDFRTLLWSHYRRDLTRRKADLSCDEANTLIQSALKALSCRWDRLRDDPLQTFADILHCKLRATVK